MHKITIDNKTIEISDESYKALKDQFIDDGMPWRAEKGEKYYFITDRGTVCFDYDNRKTKDDYCYPIGNYFKTIEEAQQELRRQEVLGRVRLAILKANGGWQPNCSDNEQEKYQIFYVCDDEEFIAANVDPVKDLLELPLVKSEETAEQIINDYQDDLKLIFGV